MEKNSMGVRKNLLALAAAVASSTLMAATVTAQERPVFRPRMSVPDAVDQAFYGSTGNNFQDVRKPIESLVGVPGFPENLIGRDSARINRVFRDLLTQQVSSDPIIRTPDLPNPYNASILTLPSINVSNRAAGSELVFER
jgi:hypothetical protein